MKKASDWTPDRIADRMAIEDVLAQYCRAVDRIDIDLLRDVFHPDATIENGPNTGGVDGFLAAVAQRHPTVPFAMHMVMNKLIDFLSPDRAFVETWCLAMERQTPEADLIVRVRYGDIFEKRDGAWAISHRATVLDHVMSVPVAEGPMPLMQGRLVGKRGPDDPLALMRAKYVTS